MPAHAVYIVLFAALMHAAWNAIVKSGDDKLLTAVMITTAAAAIAALVLPLLAQPARASWPFIAGSVSLQTVYYALLAAAYRRAEGRIPSDAPLVQAPGFTAPPSDRRGLPMHYFPQGSHPSPHPAKVLMERAGSLVHGTLSLAGLRPAGGRGRAA